MNCRDIESLLLAERDGELTTEEHAALAQHVTACPACRQFRANLTEATLFMKMDAANVAVPDAGGEWRKLRDAKARPTRKHPLAPVIWFAAPLAAAAALTFAFVNRQPKPPEMIIPDNDAATEAELAQAGILDAQTLVYVDQESGWLVVWTTDKEIKDGGG
jgi:anti-sigma factor RsiW